MAHVTKPARTSSRALRRFVMLLAVGCTPFAAAAGATAPEPEAAPEVAPASRPASRPTSRPAAATQPATAPTAGQLEARALARKLADAGWRERERVTGDLVRMGED